MKRLMILLIAINLLSIRVYATEFIAPTAPQEAQKYMPIQQNNFWEDLWYIFQQALPDIAPTLYSAIKTGISVIAICLAISLLQNISNLSIRAVELAGTVCIGTLLISSSHNFITLATQTVESISEYGKLLFPVMTAALASEGGATSSTTLYTGTVIFNTLITSGINKLIIPILYAYLALGIVLSVSSASVLKSIKDFYKWLITWSLKISIYLFTAYLGITKVISGTIDAAAIKATKLTISGVVPMVGGMISDASETILLSVGLVKNAAGIYGVLTMVSICLVPFLSIGLQCAVLKLAEGICGLFGSKMASGIIHEFVYCMDVLLAITGAVCILLMVSVVCFMKGVA